jgi:hypothetical protein
MVQYGMYIPSQANSIEGAYAMSWWEQLGRIGLWLLGAFFFFMAARSIVTQGAFGLIFAVVYGFFAGLCVAGMISEKIGWRFGQLTYPLAYLKSPARRIAAAESMMMRRDYAGAQTALEGILREEPGNLSAGLCLAKLFIAEGDVDGKTEACALLLSQLERNGKAVSGGSDTVLLLSDLLEELGLHEEAVKVLKAELAKGYCKAETGLLDRRLAALEKA